MLNFWSKIEISDRNQNCTKTENFGQKFFFPFVKYTQQMSRSNIKNYFFFENINLDRKFTTKTFTSTVGIGLEKHFWTNIECLTKK